MSGSIDGCCSYNESEIYLRFCTQIRFPENAFHGVLNAQKQFRSHYFSDLNQVVISTIAIQRALCSPLVWLSFFPRSSPASSRLDSLYWNMSAVPPLPVQATGGAASPATAPSAAQLTSTRSSLPRAAAQQANLAGNGSAAKKQPAKEEPQHIFEEEATEGVTSNWEVAVSRSPARLPLAF